MNIDADRNINGIEVSLFKSKNVKDVYIHGGIHWNSKIFIWWGSIKFESDSYSGEKTFKEYKELKDLLAAMEQFIKSL